MIILLFSLIFIGEDVFGKMVKLSQETGVDMGPLEPFILINSYKIHAMLIPIVFIVIMSDFPTIDRSGFFAISRINRKIWFYGEQLYAAMVSVTIMLILFFGSFIWNHDFFLLKNRWSPYMTELYKDNYEKYEEDNQLFIRTETLSQGHPVEVFIISIVLMVLLLIMIALILAFFKMVYLKKLGIFISMIICVAGIRIDDKFKWLFPINHSIFAEHFNVYLAKPKMPLIYSFLYFAIIIIALTGLDVMICKNFNIDEKNEE